MITKLNKSDTVFKVLSKKDNVIYFTIYAVKEFLLMTHYSLRVTDIEY